MPKVLIVEDEGLVALELREWIECEKDAEPVTASSIAQAEKIIEGGVDFVVLDINVVGGNTFGLARKLLSQHIPFMFASGFNLDDLPDDLRAAPLAAKPYQRRTVITLLREALSPRGLRRG